MSLVFGVSYNRLILLYIILFGTSLFMTFYYAIQIKIKSVELTLGMKWFLTLSGVALFVAWLPDIILTIIKGTSLSIIEVYTTEITYVLDMGIICPMCFLTMYLLKRKNAIGTFLLLGGFAFYFQRKIFKELNSANSDIMI